MNRIQRDLMLGGQIAVGRDLATSAGIYDHLVTVPMTDWWWARSRGVLNTVVGRNSDTITLTQGSTSATLGATVADSLAGYRIRANNLPTIPLISAHSGGSASVTLDAAWPEDTQTAVTCEIFKLSNSLASDFLRFASPPYVHNTWAQGLSVGAVQNRAQNWPLSLVTQGIPTMAFMTAPQTVEVNAWDTRAYRFEYEYVAMPSDLAAGGTTLLPQHHRPILSVGTSMLIAHDKGDDRAKTFASEFRELAMRMMQEHRRMISGGSSTFGMFKTRQGSGHRSYQSNGELFLV